MIRSFWISAPESHLSNIVEDFLKFAVNSTVSSPAGIDCKTVVSRVSSREIKSSSNISCKSTAVP